MKGREIIEKFIRESGADGLAEQYCTNQGGGCNVGEPCRRGMLDCDIAKKVLVKDFCQPKFCYSCSVNCPQYEAAVNNGLFRFVPIELVGGDLTEKGGVS